MRRTSSSLLLLALFVPGALSGCQTVPPRPGANVRPLPGAGLAEVNPSDVVVAPVEDRVGGLPVDVLRQAFHDTLPRKRYAPIDLGYADERAVEAGYRPGDCEEDAVLEIVVHRWGDEHWELRTALDVDIEVRLVDARVERDQPLWAVRLDQRFDLGGQAATYGSDSRRMREACLGIARELLSTLPARQTAPTPRLDDPGADPGPEPVDPTAADRTPDAR